MNSITRKCNKCQQVKNHLFFSSAHKSLCLSCYGKVVADFTDAKVPANQSPREVSERKIEKACKSVYLIQGGELVKIGIAQNVKIRLRTLSLASPVPLRVIFSFQSRNARKTEIELHIQFSKKRFHGEWFSLTAEDIQNIKEKYT